MSITVTRLKVKGELQLGTNNLKTNEIEQFTNTTVEVGEEKPLPTFALLFPLSAIVIAIAVLLLVIFYKIHAARIKKRNNNESEKCRKFST